MDYIIYFGLTSSESYSRLGYSKEKLNLSFSMNVRSFQDLKISIY